MCSAPLPHAQRYCSAVCQRAGQRARYAKLKHTIVKKLGDGCVCQGCVWHDGPCAVRSHALLEVDHSKGNGYIIRRSRHGKRAVSNTVGRYLREIEANPTGHGLQLLCANCHRAVTVQRRTDP